MCAERASLFGFVTPSCSLKYASNLAISCSLLYPSKCRAILTASGGEADLNFCRAPTKNRALCNLIFTSQLIW